MNATLDTPAPSNIRPAALRSFTPAITLEASLIGIESARIALRCSESQLLAWIASGELEWAFDLRAGDSSRSYIRVLTQSVVKLQQTKRPSNLRRNWRAWVAAAPSFEDVFDSIFRHHRSCIRGGELAREWNCGSSHITNLVDLNLLEVAQKSHFSNQSRLLSRKSVADFMQQRRMVS